MSFRKYYKVALTATTAKDRLAGAKAAGITKSIFAHEPPQVKVAPDKSYLLVRVHWEKEGDEATIEAKSYVAIITDLQSAELVANWA